MSRWIGTLGGYVRVIRSNWREKLRFIGDIAAEHMKKLNLWPQARFGQDNVY